jgi:hypothetical protein
MSEPAEKAVSDATIPRAIRWACVLALVALSLIVWPLFDGKPLPVVIGLSLGQMLGTFSLLLYLVSVVRDLRRKPKTKAE